MHRDWKASTCEDGVHAVRVRVGLQILEEVLGEKQSNVHIGDRRRDICHRVQSMGQSTTLQMPILNSKTKNNTYLSCRTPRRNHCQRQHC